MENKRGAEMTIGTIVVIVLAIAVLVFLIFGFTTGWSNLWERLGIYGGAGENVNDIVTACTASCGQSDSYGWNTKTYEIRNENKYENKSITCDQLASGVTLYRKGATPETVTVSNVLEDCPTL